MSGALQNCWVENRRNNQWQNSPTSNSYCKSKTKTRRSGQGAWRGVDEISGMRDGGHTIPVKLLSQLGLSVSPPCSTNSSMGLSRYKRLRLRFTFWTVCTARTGQFKAVDPQYEQRTEGHKLGSVRMARPGRTTSGQQWRLNGLRVCDTRMACICTNVDCAQVSCSRYFLHKWNGSARSY